MKNADWREHKRLQKARKLFTRYDEGIRISDTMLYSVTKEKIANYTASQVSAKGYKYVVDGCGGAGGNSIAFSLAGMEVALVDINPNNIYDAEHNSLIYGADENIYFYEEDILKFDCSIIPGFDATHSLFFCSPEWGGPGYHKIEKFNGDDLNPPLSSILAYAREQGYPETLIYAPKNIDLEQVEQLGCLESEYMYYEGRCNALCLWFKTGKPLTKSS